MANVYGPPKDDPVPDLDQFRDGEYGFDLKALAEAEDAWKQRQIDAARAAHPGDDLAGEVIRFPRGDGYAYYMVWRSKPLDLMHLPLGDAWTIEPFAERGLRLDDVRKLVDREHALDEIFGRGKEG